VIVDQEYADPGLYPTHLCACAGELGGDAADDSIGPMARSPSDSAIGLAARTPLTPDTGEHVLGIPRRRITLDGDWRGVLYGPIEPYLERIATEGTFRPRAAVEDDPSWKQVIPYLVLRDRGSIFLMRRTRAGGDARLHERYSVGIGGHVNPQDGDVIGGLRREWSEELVADFEPEFRLVGLLNDDSDPVGAVHVGIVYSAEADGRSVTVRETHKLEGAFVAPLDVTRVYDRLETWSSLLFDFLIGRAGGTRAVSRRTGARPG
jgi:predicted NUDIX family phosphoesterase